MTKYITMQSGGDDDRGIDINIRIIYYYYIGSCQNNMIIYYIKRNVICGAEEEGVEDLQRPCDSDLKDGR